MGKKWAKYVSDVRTHCYNLRQRVKKSEESVFKVDFLPSPRTPTKQIKSSCIEQHTPVFTKLEEVYKHISLQGAHPRIIKNIGPTFIASYAGHALMNSSPIKRFVNNSGENREEPNTSKLLANARILRDISNRINKKPYAKNKSPKIAETCYKIEHPSNVTTNIWMKKYNSGSRASEIKSVKSYTDIASQIKLIKNLYGYTDPMIAGALRKLSQNQPLDESWMHNSKVIQTLSHLVTLLYVVEVDRNCGSIITTNMFLDLVESGSNSFDELPILLPMAMEKAVKSSKTCEKFFLSPSIKGYISYDNSGKAFGMNNETLATFIQRNKKIFELWVKSKGYKGKDISLAIYHEEIKNSMLKWNNFFPKRFPDFTDENHPENIVSNEPDSFLPDLDSYDLSPSFSIDNILYPDLSIIGSDSNETDY